MIIPFTSKNIFLIKTTLLVLFTLSTIFSLSAQKKDKSDQKFDSIYFHIASNVSGTDIERAFRMSDSLHSFSESNVHKVRALMLTSYLYQQQGNIEQSLSWASKGERMAKTHKIYEWQAKIAGFLSTQYRNIGLYEKGKTYLDTGLNASKKIGKEDNKNLFIGMVYQEKSYYSIEDRDLDKALEYTKLADNYFNKLPSGFQKKYFIGTNEQLLGLVYLKKEKYDLSLKHYELAQSLTDSIVEENGILKGFIYNGLGINFLKTNKYKLSEEYLNKAHMVAESSQHINLKLDVYDGLSQYYLKTDDYKNHSLYKDKYISTLTLYEKNKKKYISNLVEELQAKNNKLSYSSDFFMVLLSTLILVIIVLAILIQRKKKRDLLKFKTIINKLTEEIKTKEKTEEDNSTDEKSKSKISISEKKETEILLGLEKFENNKGFLEKNISLTLLAGELKTNTIYLSYILNNRLNKDFNTYINELKIRYIAQKLKANKEYRLYKISYLAEESGFSSHSKFSAVFKSITGFSPSTFINHLEKTDI